MEALVRLAASDIDLDSALDIAGEIGHMQAVFDHFMEEMEDPNLPTRDGIKVITDFEPDEEIARAAPGWQNQWDYWKAAALECAALNYKEGEAHMPTNTEEHVGDTYAKHFMTTNPLASPHYNVSIGMMKFATHQVLHAFERVHGLSYPDPDGTRAYGTPGPALETAAFGSSALEREVGELWPKFIEDTAKRVGFDIKSIL